MTEPTKPSAPGPLLSIAREPGRTFFTDLNALCKEYGIRTFSCALFDVTEGAHPFVDGCKLTAGPACTDDPGYHNSYFDSTESPVTYPDDPGTNARAVLAIDLYAPQDEEVS